MNALTPIAVTGASILRAIQIGEFTSLTDLATRAEREPKNITRDLARLEEAGLVSLETKARPILTGAGLEQLAAIDRANAPRVLHSQIERDPFNPRVDFDEEFIKGLAESIYDGGKLTLLQNLVIRPIEDGEKPYRLVAGEQRWRAIGLLIADGRWPADLPVPTTIRILTDEEAEVLALIENVQRQNLNPIDEAKRYKHFRDVRGWSTARIAEAANRSQKHVQNLLRCLELPEDVQARMRLPKGDERHIGAREARGMFQAQREPQTPRLELEPRLALALAELAHKVETDPASEVGEPGFTRISGWPTVGPIADLNAQRVVTFKAIGPKTFAKVLAHSSGALAWLEGQDFYADPQAVIDHWARLALSDEVRERHARLVAEVGGAGYYTRILIVPEFLDEEAADELAQTEPKTAPAKPPATAAQILTLAEISAIIEPDLARPRYDYAVAKVRPTIAEVAVVKELLGSRLLELLTPSEYGSFHFQMRIGHHGWRALNDHLAGFVSAGAHAAARSAVLETARDRAREAGCDPIALARELRSFFAGDIEIPPEGKAYAEAHAERERQQKARDEQAAAERQAREDNIREDQEKGADFLIDIRAFEAIAEDMDANQFATCFAKLLQAHGLEGPFTVDLYNQQPAIRAVGSDKFLAASGPMFEALRRIQVIALNHAIGSRVVYSGDALGDPDAPAEAEGDTTDWEPETEEEFWRITAQTFEARYGVSEARAAELLQLAMARLEAEGAAYGDDSCEWSRLDAEFVATGYVEDFPGCVAPQAQPLEAD